jgi:tetratricopeptide (TPR) repeat protein
LPLTAILLAHAKEGGGVFVALWCLLGAVIVSIPVQGSSLFGQQMSARTLSGDELVRIGEIHDVQNHYREALTYYERALDAYRGHKHKKGEAVVLTKIASIFERQGRRQEAAVSLSQALALFAQAPDSPAHADALYASGRISLWIGPTGEAGNRFEQAKDRYRRSHNARALGAVMLHSGLLKISDASSEEGLHEIEQALNDARSRRDDEQTLAALVALGDANWILDRTDMARTQYEQALALLTQRPQPTSEAAVRIRLAALSETLGREAEGVESARRAVTLYQSLRDLSGEAASWALLASLHEALGQHADAEEALRRSLVIYRQQSVIVHAIGPTARPAVTVPRESR